jgi:rubrerythrin
VHVVLLDIANKEKEHAGKFLRLRHDLNQDEEKFYKSGSDEVEEIIEDLKHKK